MWKFNDPTYGMDDDDDDDKNDEKTNPIKKFFM